MSRRYSARSCSLAANIILEAAVADARARLAGPGDPALAYDENARTLLVAMAAVELIDGASR